MAKKDYYEILGVNKNATDNEIKRAYKRLANKYHPDKNQGSKEAEEKFKEVKEAAEILTDSEKRAMYDQYGHSAFDQSQGGFGGGFSGGFGGFEDIFESFFGGGSRSSRRRGPTPGEDLQYQVEITLEEAASGIKKEISYQTIAHCNNCDGSGGEKGSKVETCNHCHGQGRIRYQQGPFISEQGCHYCGESGKKFEKKCKSCNGGGKVYKNKTITVNIPAGVDSGNRMRVSGGGAAGEKGAPNGDLYLFIQVKPHHIFEREGQNLYCELPISFTKAALGGEIEVPTLTGRLKFKLPKESQTGKMFRLRGKGMPSGRNGFTGDLICKVLVETPVNLDDEQKALLEKLEESLEGKRNMPKHKGFFDKIKDFFDNK